ncbi:hypothetical protein ESCO_004964 [Escovopsis weberi]|uniref:Uncharacterized protein n=1 Tax=Escovopsis weberi TaxID=150374 RepID=A0A0M9VW01_ESCWE|nr:hypothetical protein ESCO_004964 [Escovopsis weberi]
MTTGRNTTLPHPEADLSPDACITHDESAGDMMSQQRRRPTGLLHRARTRRAAKETLAEPNTGEVFGSSFLSLARPESRSDKDHLHQSFTRSSSATFSSRDGAESIAERDDEGTPPTSPESERAGKRHVFGISKWKR